MSSRIPTRPRPCGLCRAQLPAPGPAEARCTPGPGASLTSRARNLFSRECRGVLGGLYFPGARGASECSGSVSPRKARDGLGGLGPPSCAPSLSHPCTDPIFPPTKLLSFIMRKKRLGKLKIKGKGPQAAHGFCHVPSFASGKAFLSPHGKSHLPSNTIALGFSILNSQEVLPDVQPPLLLA